MSMEQAMTRDELIKRIGTVQNTQHKALLSFLYLTGARWSEIVRQVRVFNITFERIGEAEFMVVNNVITRKRQKEIRRNIPIKMMREMEFLDFFLPYYKQLRHDDLLFPFGKVKTWYICKRAIGRSPHFLRHCRITHLFVNYKFDAHRVKEITAHGSSQSLDTYAHLNWKNVAEEM